MIRLNLASVGMVEDTGSVILVLRAPEQEQMLVMEVGLLEGRAIAMEAEGVRAPRPLTHDLLFQIIERLGARIRAVQIHDFREKTFFAEVVLEGADSGQVILDARPSDAIALALRASAPIYASEQVLVNAGVKEEDEEAEIEAELAEDEDDDDEGFVH